jgi:hypothetical protein
MAWETCFRSLRLVNNRLALVGKRYVAFKLLVTSERQLQTPDEEAKLYMRFTRCGKMSCSFRTPVTSLNLNGSELTIQRIPVFHYLPQLREIYHNITHLTLSNIRLKPVDGDEELVSLPSVRYLWLEVTNATQTYIPKLLESFPALQNLALHSDPRTPPMVCQCPSHNQFTTITLHRWIQSICFPFLSCRNSLLYIVHLGHSLPSIFPPAFISVMDPIRGIGTSCYPLTSRPSSALLHQTRPSRTSTRWIAPCAGNGTRALRTAKNARSRSLHVTFLV